MYTYGWSKCLGKVAGYLGMSANILQQKPIIFLSKKTKQLFQKAFNWLEDRKHNLPRLSSP